MKHESWNIIQERNDPLIRCIYSFKTLYQYSIYAYICIYIYIIFNFSYFFWLGKKNKQKSCFQKYWKMKINLKKWKLRISHHNFVRDSMQIPKLSLFFFSSLNIFLPLFWNLKNIYENHNFCKIIFKNQKILRNKK